jgi:tetratricopeptide (TPR) repeat protein
MKTYIIIFISVIFIVGCGVSNQELGKSYLSDNNYKKALEVLTKAVKDDPNNPKAHKELGITYYKLGQYDKALDELKTAKSKLNKDSNVMLYLGLTYERMEQYDNAIKEYSGYAKMVHLRRMRKLIQQKAQALTQKQAEQWAKERIRIENVIDAGAFPENTVAVTYFKPIGVSENVLPLHKGLTDLLIMDLSLVKELSVVERVKMKEIYNELGLASTSLVDESAAPRFGKILGASFIITGAFTDIGNEKWRIDPMLGKVKLNTVQNLESVEGELRDFLETEKSLVFNILDMMGIKLSSDEHEKILRNIPTESLSAFLAYSKGIDYADKGMYVEATKEFENAVSLDPDFTQARKNLNESVSLQNPIGTPDNVEIVLDQELNLTEIGATVLTTTTESVSKSDINQAPISSLEQTEPQEVSVKLIIKW